MDGREDIVIILDETVSVYEPTTDEIEYIKEEEISLQDVDITLPPPLEKFEFSLRMKNGKESSTEQALKNFEVLR